MFQNYLRVAFRNLWKNRMHTLFNVLGLSMGVGVCITVFFMVYPGLNMDRFHPDADQIYMIGHVKELKSGLEKWGLTPGGLAPAVKKDFAEVERAVRVDMFDANVRYGEKLFSERIYFVEPEFLDMFSFPLQSGSTAAFGDPSSILISHETALKYFGDESPIGKSITVRFDESRRKEFTVVGVFEKFPRTASFTFEFLTNYDMVRYMTDRPDGWDYTIIATFVKLRRHHSAPDFENRLQRYVRTYNDIRAEQPIHSFFLEPLTTLSTHSNQIRGDLSSGINPHGMRALAIIALLVMLMACFNFMNNMIGASARRFKEVGVRKVVGGSRSQLMRQFLGESLLVSLFSLVGGFVLAEAFFNPFMGSIVEEFSFMFEWSTDWPLVVFLTVLVTTTGILSGLYPSLMLSGFQPVRIFRDLARVGSNRWLTRSLVVMQFAICLFAIVAAIVFKQNNDFLSELDLGFRGDQVAVLGFQTAAEWETFRNAVIHQPGVKKIVGSTHQVGLSRSVGLNVESEGASFQSNVLRIGPGYFEMMDMKVYQGRAFDEKLKSDVDESVMINRLLAEQLGWTHPVGKRVRLEGREYTVVGVAENFYTNTFMRPIEPVLLKMVPESGYRVMSIQFDAARLEEVTNVLKSTWALLMPYEPFHLRFQDQVFEEDVTENENIIDMFLYLAAMTMIIAATGLFALVSLNITRRTKEIGVRKVLGASAVQIMQLINREFYTLIVVSAALIFPIAYFLLNGLLNSVFATHVGLSVWPFVGAVAAMMLLSVITIGSRVIKVAVENPVRSLRYE
jgi:ABC-type antimicrobial peptide transport system permease subunit